MRLNDRHAFLTKRLTDGRLIDVQAARTGGAHLVVSISGERWSATRRYWYGDALAASLAALAWDGVGEPRGARG